MRKRFISEQPGAADTTAAIPRLPVGAITEVEVTSESPGFPIESALAADPSGGGAGWRAGRPGPQVVRLHFAEPVSVKSVHLRFVENECARTQEFVLRWSPDGGVAQREIVRQQFNFAPPGGATVEEEHYSVHVHGVRTLELTIVPDINGGKAPASLAAWWIELAPS